MIDGIYILGNIYNCGSSFAGNVYDTNYFAPALMTMQGGNRQPMIIEEKHEGFSMFTISENGICQTDS